MQQTLKRRQQMLLAGWDACWRNFGPVYGEQKKQSNVKELSQYSFFRLVFCRLLFLSHVK